MSIRNNFNQWSSGTIQILTVIPGTQQVPVVEKTKKIGARKDRYIKIEPVHEKKLDGISKPVYNRLRAIIGNKLRHIINHRNKTISIKDAITINEVAEEKIFNINEEDVQKYSTHLSDLRTLGKGRKRQLPASSENPTAISKKQRTDADDQPTIIDVNAPYHHEIPMYYVYPDPSHEIPTSTTPQESIISPGTPVVSNELNSTFDSNAAAETKQSESSSTPTSPSNSSEVFKDFEFDELNNDDDMAILWNRENRNIDWSDWSLNLNL
jgi:hypothetical protein